MKPNIQNFILVVLNIFLLFFSCREEETIRIQAPENEVLVANSLIADLILKTTSNDGSKDNILDKSNCFNIKLPITVTANGKVVIVNSEDDYKIIEYIFDDSDDDIDTLVFTYPLTVTLNDFTEVAINNNSELVNYSNNCNGPNEADDDIECLDFTYPITASLYNSNNEITKVITMTNDDELYKFISNIESLGFVTISFPITVTLLDGMVITINNLTELESTIETHNNNCDEDDDYDYNDDDCNDCNIEQLASILTSCSDWVVDKLKRDGNNLDDFYDGYTFNFFSDGTVTSFWGNKSATGTWVASGEGNNLIVTINIPGLDNCNNNWTLQEISEYTETRINFNVGDNDRLRYTKGCN